MSDGNTVRLTQAAPSGFLGAQAPATGPTPPADTASTQVVRPGDVAAAQALGGPPGTPARAEEEDGTEAPGAAATRVLSALDVAALVAPATTTLLTGITRTGHPEGVIPDGATKHLGPADLTEAARAAAQSSTQSTTQTISLKDLAHVLPESSATHRISAADARAALAGQGPAATQVVPGAQPASARTAPPGSTPPGGATAAGSATPVPPASQNQSAQPQSAQAAGAPGGQIVHGPVSPAPAPAAPAPAPAAAQNAAHQTPDAPLAPVPSGMSAGTTAAAGATSPASVPPATTGPAGTTADPTSGTTAEPVAEPLPDPVVDPAADLVAAPVQFGAAPAATTGAAPIPAAPLPAAAPQSTTTPQAAAPQTADPATTAASAPAAAPTTPVTGPATADPVTTGPATDPTATAAAQTAGAATTAAGGAEDDASFTGAAKADLEKAGAALDAVDKGQVKLAMDNQSVDELLKLITEARDMVSSVHVTALTSLDVELRFGDNWVGRSISKRLHDLAVGDESSAVNVIGDFLRILLEVEETIRKAARNIRNADDDAKDNFDKSGWGHH
ncbi:MULTISPECIES: hypothetical protein [Actinosynnema]|uniref:hypothetical protein n=1 Tax=Actinosynnema TaxID=40566 RepID=UPI0020A4CD55|nr:hypothetical protein [Actinosynnema pretiosum]MCP2093334.1 hypothetical protein [Actinosynnema pretiosum]